MTGWMQSPRGTIVLIRSESSFDNDLKEVQEKTQTINRKRMNDQQRSYEKLTSLHEQALELQMKNYIMTVSGERDGGD